MSDILSSPLPITISQLRKDYIERARAVGLQPIVLMDGSLSCEIAIVGEAPGVREVELGSPFVGGSGALLWNNLRKIGITREKVYTTNVIKRQVSLSERGNARATIGKSELQHWESLLRWELSQLPNLKYVLILGAYALHSLMAIDGVTNWRGSRLVYVETSSLRSLETLVTYNPAMVLREPKTEIVFATDIKKFDRLLRGDLTHPQIKAHYDLSPQGVHELCDRLQDENLPISFDIETMHGETACIGISNSETEGWCVNFRTLEEHFYSSSDELRVRLRLQSLLGAADQRLVAQNGNFDMYWMWYKDRIRANRVWFDTLLAHHTLYPQLPHGLGFLTTVYTDHPYYKDEGKTWREGVADINKFWEYNVKDVCITLQVQRKLLKELEDQKLDKYFFDHVMHLQPHLAKMTVHGVLCDTKERDKLAEQSAAETVTALDDFHSALGRAELSDPTWRPNIRSINDMKRLYLRELKLVARGDSVDDENRDRMLKHPSTPETAKEIILAHNRYAKAFKFNSTYARIPLDNDSRFRSEYKQYGTQKAPGRLSSSSTLWGSGTNLQNQPPRARSMFIADPGFVFGYFDLSQAEARYVAWDANIESWKSQFEKARIDGSYDAHRALAATMFRVPYDQTPTKDEIDGKYTIRYIAKRCRHGLNYRMGPDRLATTTGLPLHECLRHYQMYHHITPELQRWWARLEREVRQTRCLFNSYGGRLLFMQRLDDAALESIVAYRPQSSIGVKVSRVMYQCQEDDNWPLHTHVLLNVHDSLTCLGPPDTMKTALAIMKRYAEEPVPINGEQLIIPADLAISEADETGTHRWSTLKKIRLD